MGEREKLEGGFMKEKKYCRDRKKEKREERNLRKWKERN